MNELDPMLKNMKSLVADFSDDLEQTLPETFIFESEKSYQKKHC